MAASPSKRHNLKVKRNGFSPPVPEPRVAAERSHHKALEVIARILARCAQPGDYGTVSITFKIVDGIIQPDLKEERYLYTHRFDADEGTDM